MRYELRLSGCDINVLIPSERSISLAGRPTLVRGSSDLHKEYCHKSAQYLIESKNIFIVALKI